MISGNVMRCAGSGVSSARRRARQSGEATGVAYSAARIRGNICCSRTMLLARSSPLLQKGKAPVSMMNSITPQDQMSATLPSYEGDVSTSGGDVVGRAGQALRLGVQVLVLAVSEVADFQQWPLRSAIQQCILQLDVTVSNAFFVAEVKRHNELLEEPPRQLLVQPLGIHKSLVAHEEVEHVTPRRILHADAQIPFCKEHLPELDDVW
eukprot:CAMPEP_0206140206 /NCGR_PEP_ID=MMETSP1473-20131121/8692_1 /ASSEMBLY_ACC=CAM_ASM_001109 /TAXON_ID=1461547 /ORGANISM="Stichococcus sp, Strain RCC1054" /LENGTH=207 /DNA_ID=CAMNT_0053534277 /DNA_START=1104 /DNA_END=1723 /DNA_ORIENTATION=+